MRCCSVYLVTVPASTNGSPCDLSQYSLYEDIAWLCDNLVELCIVNTGSGVLQNTGSGVLQNTGSGVLQNTGSGVFFYKSEY